MREWIVGLQKAAKTKLKGIDPMRWFRLDGGVNAVPDELRDVYEVMDGARLPPNVTLLPFFSEEGVRGVVERSVEAPGWTFGEKGPDETLITARKKDIPAELLPEWAHFLRDDEWLYAVRAANGTLRCFRSMEHMMRTLVPPAETEEFGEVTYAKALSAIQSQLGNLVQVESKAAPKKAKLPKKKPVARKKSSPRKVKVAAKVSKKKVKATSKKAAKKVRPPTSSQRKPAKASKAAKASKKKKRS